MKSKSKKSKWSNKQILKTSFKTKPNPKTESTCFLWFLKELLKWDTPNPAKQQKPNLKKIRKQFKIQRTPTKNSKQDQTLKSKQNRPALRGSWRRWETQPHSSQCPRWRHDRPLSPLHLVSFLSQNMEKETGFAWVPELANMLIPPNTKFWNQIHSVLLSQPKSLNHFFSSLELFWTTPVKYKTPWKLGMI